MGSDLLYHTATEAAIEHAVLSRYGAARETAVEAWLEREAAHQLAAAWNPTADDDDYLADPAWWWLLGLGCVLSAGWLTLVAVLA